MDTKETRFGRLGTAFLLAACAGACGASQATPVEPQQESGAVVLGAGPSVKQDPPAPPLRVNQLGYLPGWPKFATMVNPSQEKAQWELLDETGKVVAKGQTEPLGNDADSGDPVHRIDFSSFVGEGKAMKLRVGKEQSPPFDLRNDLFAQIKSDALWYFYHSRSGIAIEMPYAGAEKWTRPAGHLSDKEVACAPKETLLPDQIPCDYSLDVAGGWYDAGDQGKYVVNAGISVWTLLNLYERMAHRNKEALAEFADGKLRLPEQGNRVPDLLDEVRWEVEWMMKMQVPEGKPMAGMAHHKIHDEKWTGMGTKPPTDIAELKMKRYLRPVSTAATLNLAAAAAQASRVFREFDAAFAARCIQSAERAFRAAKANPKVLAPEKDTMGGGPYGDTRLEDEFYWATAELFITTGKPEYKKEMLASKFHDRIPDGSNADGSGPKTLLTWQSVSGAGTASLAIVPNKLGEAGMKAARKEILRNADLFLAQRDRQGYRTPLEAIGGKYPWGSNSFVLNNMLALALAHDLTGDQKYLTGVVDGMNYLLGVNGMGQSYVTGYGTRPLKNPHHRFWSHELGPAFPEAPPGCISGGPNSGIEDPIASGAGLAGCKPQKCFIDRLDAWSVNEITINWNAPFAWLTAYLDEQARKGAR